VLAYILRRILLIIPTLVGIMVLNFIIVQAAPGGPVEQTIAKLRGTGDVTARVTGGDQGRAEGGGGQGATSGGGSYRGARGLPPELIKQNEHLYGFDQPA
jgi:microcin C transport system permease protein